MSNNTNQATKTKESTRLKEMIKTNEAIIAEKRAPVINEDEAYDAIKSLRNGKTCSYKVCFDNLLYNVGHRYSCPNDIEAKAYLIALVYRYFTEGEKSFNRALVSLALAKGFSLDEKIGERRKTYADMIHDKSENVRKSEDKIFKCLIGHLHQDLQTFDDTKEFVEMLKKTAINNKVLKATDENHYILVMPSLTIRTRE